MMENSLIFKLYFDGMRPGVQADPNMFKEVYRSEFGKVRIFAIRSSKTSKEWVEQNRGCDGGGWFCPGKYPPGLKEILDKKKDFAQPEDFNREESDEEYRKEYLKNLNNPDLARNAQRLENDKQKTDQSKPKDEKSAYSTWEDNEDTARMWHIVANNDVKQLKRWLKKNPEAAWIRSADGRGPMWWAFESKKQDIVAILVEMGIPNTDKDKDGISPIDLLSQSS
jgi:dolichyl-diphosphooligosaccharide--protein glycosyltransferase